MNKYVLILSLLFFLNPLNSFGDDHYYDDLLKERTISRLEFGLYRFDKDIREQDYSFTYKDNVLNGYVRFRTRYYYNVICGVNYNPLLVLCNLEQKQISLNKENDPGMKMISQFVAREIIITLAGFSPKPDNLGKGYFFRGLNYKKTPKNVKDKVSIMNKSYSDFINNNLRIIVKVINKKGRAASTDFKFKQTKKYSYVCETEYFIFPIKEEINLSYLSEEFPIFQDTQFIEKCSFS